MTKQMFENYICLWSYKLTKKWYYTCSYTCRSSNRPGWAGPALALMRSAAPRQRSASTRTPKCRVLTTTACSCRQAPGARALRWNEKCGLFSQTGELGNFRHFAIETPLTSQHSISKPPVKSAYSDHIYIPEFFYSLHECRPKEA